MSTSAEQSRDHEIIARWRDLTERQVANLIDMYESGRWKRYYDAAEFRDLMRESMAAVSAWQQLDSVCRQIESGRGRAVAAALDIDADGPDFDADLLEPDEDAPSRALQSLQRFSLDFTRRGGG